MIVVFAGSSITDGDRSELNALYRPPAAQGDVYKATKAGAKVIAIIDGLFDEVASVWHKEVLWALHCGVHVLGAASMGALRAAELHQFGMVGIGKVFEAFRDGDLEDDDEVAVFHGDAASDFVQLSDAMVDIRRAVSDAVEAGIVSPPSADVLINFAKALHYRDRSFARILEDKRVISDISREELVSLRVWLQRHARSQKREDAIELLRYVEANREKFEAPFESAFRFEPTVMWYEFKSSFGEVSSMTGGDNEGTLTLEDILDEARLLGDVGEVLKTALYRFMLIREHERAGYALDHATVLENLERFRRESGLLTADSFNEWRSDSGLSDQKQIKRFFNDQARMYSLRDRLQPSASHYVVDVLRENKTYGRLVRRARLKQEVITRIRVQRSEAEIQDTMARALDWFSSSGRDQADFKRLGFSDFETFAIAVWKEYEFALSSDGFGGQNGVDREYVTAGREGL